MLTTIGVSLLFFAIMLLCCGMFIQTRINATLQAQINCVYEMHKLHLEFYHGYRQQKSGEEKPL